MSFGRKDLLNLFYTMMVGQLNVPSFIDSVLKDDFDYQWALTKSMPRKKKKRRRKELLKNKTDMVGIILHRNYFRTLWD